MIVIGVKNLTKLAGKILLLNSLLIVTLVEGIKLEALYRLCIPDTKGVYNSVSIADNRQIIRNSLNDLIAFLLKCSSASLIGVHIYIAAKLNLLGVLISSKLEGISVLQPGVRNLNLISILDLLTEHTVFITDSAAIGHISKS